jgi:hypothetical protein
LARLALALLAAAPLALVTGCASVEAESYLAPGFDPSTFGRLAVVDGQDKVFVDETRQAILDTFQMEFMKKGWRVIERSNINRVIDEMNFENADFTSPENRKQLGHILNVEALLVVNLATSGKDVSMTSKMIEVETGELLWMGSGDGALNQGLGAMTGAIVGAAAGAAVGKGNGATAIGGVVGGSVGYMLGPSQLEGAKDVVKAICVNLPAVR